MTEQLPPVDPGNPHVLSGVPITLTRGVLKRDDGSVVYVLTLRQGVATFTLPFESTESILGFAKMIMDDAQKLPTPSGLIVPQPGTPIPDLTKMTHDWSNRHG